MQYGMSLKTDIYCYDHGVIDPMTLIILTLATMGATRIVVWDKITMPIRAKIIKKTSQTHWLTFLIHCVTCTGFWAAVAVVGSWLLWPGNRALTAIYIILTVAWLAPSLMNIENRITGGE